MANPLSDETTDFADAGRGLIAALEPDAYGLLSAACPETANPCLRPGLYEVTEGIYQVRGLDISHMTLVEGDRGVIVIDPLVSVETAAVAIGLYRRHRGDRPVTAVIYTHSHGDHFGGVAGVTDGDVPILAPLGFVEHTVSENVSSSTAMTPRALYPDGAGPGIAMRTPSTVSPFPPTVDVTHTGQAETVDGVRIVFQVMPGTGTPAEMSFLFPARGALCLADNAGLSGCLTETIALFGVRADVAFASHHWPTWGRSNIMRYLSGQRDAYAYLHDQTLRLLNKGRTDVEIAELIQLPPVLETAWHARGYQVSVSHHVKAIYQRCLGRPDGDPAGLWRHPPVETARRYVECLGGVGNVVAKAHEFVDSGDLRFAAQMMQNAVVADPENEGVKELLAQVYERLGHGADNATWRDFYLTGARELRQGITVTPAELGTEMASTLSIEQIFDSLAIRVDAPAACHESIAIDWVLEDGPYRTTLRHGVLIHHPGGDDDPADLTLRLSKAQLLGLLAGQGLTGIAHEGDPDALKRLLGHLDQLTGVA